MKFFFVYQRGVSANNYTIEKNIYKLYTDAQNNTNCRDASNI